MDQYTLKAEKMIIDNKNIVETLQSENINLKIKNIELGNQFKENLS
jgi:hypothetical protein